jgi:hypothetical protein
VILSNFFWKPQLVLFMNERTLLPVLMPLLPSATVAKRFPQALAQILTAHGIAPSLINKELAYMLFSLVIQGAVSKKRRLPTDRKARV